MKSLHLIKMLAITQSKEYDNLFCKACLFLVKLSLSVPQMSLDLRNFLVYQKLIVHAETFHSVKILLKALFRKQDWRSPVYSGRFEYICWNSLYSPLLSPTLGLPTRFIHALFGVHITGISGWKTQEYDCDLITGFRFALVFTCTFTECVT